MSDPQHTPAPWRVTTFSDRLGVVSCQTGAQIGGMGWTKRDSLSLADARLIAAAPDLLEAVKALRSGTDPDVAARLADAALAKTEGRFI